MRSLWIKNPHLEQWRSQNLVVVWTLKGLGMGRSVPSPPGLRVWGGAF